MPVWINYVEWMAKFVNIPIHTCLESMISRILHDSEFQYWYTGGAGGGGSTGASISIGSSISSICRIKQSGTHEVKLYITYTTVFQCYKCINYVNRLYPYIKEVCDCFALVRARQHAITIYNMHMVDMDNHRPGPGRQIVSIGTTVITCQ